MRATMRTFCILSSAAVHQCGEWCPLADVTLDGRRRETVFASASTGQSVPYTSENGLPFDDSVHARLTFWKRRDRKWRGVRHVRTEA